MYRGTYGTPVQVHFTATQLGINEDGAHDFEVLDVFSNKKLGIIKPSETFSVMVNPTGVRFLRLNVNPKGTPINRPTTNSSTVQVLVADPGLSGWHLDDEF